MYDIIYDVLSPAPTPATPPPSTAPPEVAVLGMFDDVNIAATNNVSAPSLSVKV